MLTAMKSAAHLMEPPSGSPSTSILAPVGVTTERVDAYTLQVIGGLFPAAGLDFLARLLRLAIVKQLALVGTNQADVAEISVTSIRQLAALIGWSYDTTEKYVRLFCVLGLLSKTREESLVVLRFALCSYIPPASLDRLDQLMVEARPKVASFAKQVRRRFVRLYGDRLQMPTSELPAPGSSAEIQGVIHELQQIMALPEAGVLQKRLAHLEKQLKEINGRFGAKMVDSAAEGAEGNGRLGMQTVGSAASAGSENGRLGAKTVDSPAEGTEENGRLETEKSTKFPAKKGQNSRLGPETAGSDAKTVDSAGSESPNANVIIKTITDQVNVNVGQASAYFRERFGEPDGNNGFYHKLQKICARPEVWLAAAIEVFVALQRQGDPLQKPGRYFFSRVCDMHHNGISPAAQELVQRYGEMSYAQLVAALRAPVLSQKANERARGQRPQPAAVEKLELRLERYREISGMSPGDLDQLRREIQARVEFCAWRTQRYHQTDGTYALLVESPLRRQIWLYSRERWRECLVPLIPQRQTEMKNSTSRNRHESGEEH